MPRIVVQAIPFCYGPAVVALRISDALAAEGHDVRLLATGSVRELAELSGVAIEEYSCTSDVVRAAADGDLYCCVCDPQMFKNVRGVAPLDVYLDFLYFMAPDSGPPPEADADLYVIENYPGVQAAFESRAWKPRNPVVVGPLVATPKTSAPSSTVKKVLLSFGGTESPLTAAGRNTRYPTLVTSVVEGLVQKSFPGCLLRTAGSPAGIESLESRCPEWSCREPLGHASFLHAVEEADVVICQPGLYTVFEAVRRDRPVVFLPPSNYTQVVQLWHYVSLGAGPASVTLERLLEGPAGSIAVDLAEELGVRRVLEALGALEASVGAMDRLRAALALQCEEIARSPGAVAGRQRQALAAFAKDGLPAAVAAIRRLQVGTPAVRLKGVEARSSG